MKIFHVYNEKYFPALEKCGLLNEDSGFKIQHAFSLPSELKFNNFAKIGSKLHSIIKEGRIPFYVDRIAGGVTYYKYDFDEALIREYKEILGDWFLGFQLHESASNRRIDWTRVLNRMEGATGPYDEKILTERSIRSYAKTVEGEQLYAFSQGSPAEYSRLTYADTPEKFMNEMRELYLKRMSEVSGLIHPADSYYLMTRLQEEIGMQSFMPEVGCQIPMMRIAVALARGIATASGKRFGLYYETWIKTDAGYTMPCYNKNQGNEWYLTQETHTDDFTTHGQNGGSSRLLQNRIYYYSLMSGADYFSEEWGLNCSFSELESCTLSPYGEIKRKFINDARKMKGVKAVRPFAIVLPKSYSCVELPEPDDRYVFGEVRDVYMKCKLTEQEKIEYGHIENLLKFIFARSGEIYGNEGHVMTNSRFGDIFDIVYEDASEEALSRYDYLIDASFGGAFAKAYSDKFRILSSSDFDLLQIKINDIAHKILPAYADTLHWLLSVGNSGERYISVFNNEGNERSSAFGDVIDHRADKTASLAFTCPASPKIKFASSERVVLSRISEGNYKLFLPGTEFAVIEY